MRGGGLCRVNTSAAYAVVAERSSAGRSTLAGRTKHSGRHDRDFTALNSSPPSSATFRRATRPRLHEHQSPRTGRRGAPGDRPPRLDPEDRLWNRVEKHRQIPRGSPFGTSSRSRRCRTVCRQWTSGAVAVRQVPEAFAVSRNLLAERRAGPMKQGLSRDAAAAFIGTRLGRRWIGCAEIRLAMSPLQPLAAPRSSPQIPEDRLWNRCGKTPPIR